MSIRYWASTRIAKDENPTPRTLGDCIHHAFHYEVPRKVQIDIHSKDITGPESGVHVSLYADFSFEFNDYAISCSKQLGFFGVPLFFKRFARKSVKKANEKLSDIIHELEQAGVNDIQGKTKRFEINDFPYLLHSNESKLKNA